MQQHLNKGRRYSGEEKAAAGRMVCTLRAELGASQGTVQRVAYQLGYGAECICSVLQVAPSTYHAANGRPASAWQVRDAEVAPQVLKTWESNYSVNGFRKLWKAVKRAGIDIGRDQVARLMKVLEIEGMCRKKRVKAKKPDPRTARHPDLVNRMFSADGPNQLWVMDLTFVPTWQGVAYVCFIIDAFSRMTGAGGVHRI